MKKILIAIDFSATTEDLIKFSFAFNQHFFAHLHFIHVFQIPFIISPETEQIVLPYDEMKKNYSDRLWTLIKEYKNNYHYDITVHIAMGGEVTEINNYALEQSIDLLIIGNKDRSRWGRWTSGSITQNFLQKPPVHVLSITSPYQYKQWKKVWVCTDLSMPLKKDQISFIKNLADHIHAEINFLHISDENEKPLEYDLESDRVILNSFQKITIHKPLKRNIPETIEEVIKNEGGDAIILFPHHHTWFDTLFLGHETTAISSEIDIPILSMKGLDN